MSWLVRFPVDWSLTLNITVDPVHVRADPSVHRVRVSGTCSASHPRGRSTDDPFSTFHAGQRAATVTVTDTAPLSSYTHHGALVHGSSVCPSTLTVARQRSVCLLENRGKGVVTWIYATPPLLRKVKEKGENNIFKRRGKCKCSGDDLGRCNDTSRFAELFTTSRILNDFEKSFY